MRISQWQEALAHLQDAVNSFPGTSATLANVRFARELLDDIESQAVWSARESGSSWAEIAAMLAVTRQSAWERWQGKGGNSARERSAERPDAAELLNCVLADLKGANPGVSAWSSPRLRRLKMDGGRGMLAADIERKGVPYLGLWGVSPGPNGSWQLDGSSLGRIGTSGKRKHWITSGGWGGDEQTWSFGGLPADSRVECVRVVDPAGTMLEDRVESGVVLFTGLRMASRATVTMYDATGEVCNSGPLLAD